MVDLRVYIKYGGPLIATGDHLCSHWTSGGTIYDNTGGPGGPVNSLQYSRLSRLS